MTTTWILVANAATAHLYQSPRAKLFNGHGELSEIGHYQHPQSQEKVANLITDKQGRHQSMHAGGGNFVDSNDVKQQEAAKFAREIAMELNKQFSLHQFDDLIVAAPGQFRGLLHQYIDRQLAQSISADIDKDYTKFTGKELISHIQNFI